MTGINPAAAAWLTAEYDATADDDQTVPGVTIQPFLKLKSDMNSGAEAMRARPADYHDPMRWWL
jgi:hypothetical protein